MNPGDMPAFQNVMTMAHEALKASTANLKHMVVFSDGDPDSTPSDALMQSIVGRPHHHQHGHDRRPCRTECHDRHGAEGARSLL
jgi:hypothetical protein